MKRAPYPLQWPEGVGRTKRSARTRSRFGRGGDVSFSQARRELLEELERLGAANVVLTSDLPVRNDGLPYASGRADDPGIAVWCLIAKGGRFVERVFACDTWLTHAENMTAIARSIGALRGLDRWGMAEAADRAFAGFTALPPGDPAPAPARAPRSWRQLFDIATNLHDVLGKAEILTLVRQRHRDRIRHAHPDAGGSHEDAVELNAALAEAERELAGVARG